VAADAAGLFSGEVVDADLVIRLEHDQALVLSDWLDRVLNTERFEALVDEDPAVWLPLRQVSGALETTLPEVFAADYIERLDRARLRVLARTGPHRATTRTSQRGGTRTSVAGWLDDTNVVRFLTMVASYVGYPYDWWDEQALVGAWDQTDDRWFEYPLVGVPALTVRLARARGSDVIAAQVVGELDDILAARVETLLDVL
jgi:hypothetical protein